MKLAAINLGKVEAARGIQGTKVALESRVRVVEVEASSNNEKHFTVISFVFEILYGKNAQNGLIKVMGKMAYNGTEEECGKVIQYWKDNKKIAPELQKEVLDTAFSKGAVKALLLAEMLNLPSPLPFSINHAKVSTHQDT